MELIFSAEHNAHIERQLNTLARGREKYAGDPRLYEIDYNEALLYLSVGRFKEGWAKFDTRFQLPGSKFNYEHFPVERWDGSALAGKHILVWLEQGVGDQILAASMLPEVLAAVGDGSVTLLCDRVLIPAFRRSFKQPNLHIHRVGEPLAKRLEEWDFDWQLSLSDIGSLTRNAWADFPGTPYIRTDAAKVIHYKHKYNTGKKLVGVAWSSVSSTTGPEKSMKLTELAPVLSREDFTFIDMQYGDHVQELKAAWAAGLNLTFDPSVDQLCDMDEFFAQVAAMDLVITTSQTLAHVAGSLGIPAYVMMPLGKGRLWYWFAETSASPWYSSVTLFRQEKLQDWSAPIKRVGAILDELTANQSVPYPTTLMVKHG